MFRLDRGSPKYNSYMCKIYVWCCMYAVSYTHLDVYKRQHLSEDIIVYQWFPTFCVKTVA